MIKIYKKNILKCLFLPIITCGIFDIYWSYLLVKNTHLIENNKKSCIGEILCSIFVPFYSLYWWYTRGKIVEHFFKENNCISKGNGILYLILAIFGMQWISALIMQNDFNSLEIESFPDDNIDLKVTGLIYGIIAAIVVVSVVFSKTVLPVIMYNNAEKYAAAENYVEAYEILVKCGDYKDSPEKRGEYILKIGQRCLESGYMDEAIEYFEIAYNSQNEDAKAKALEYLIELKPEKYN